MSKLPFEPFRIKMVEPIRVTTREERLAIMDRTQLSLFPVRSDEVLIDLFTDSGTGTMSSAAWGAMFRGDEAYASATSWFRFEAAVQEVFGFSHVIPVHQGRAAERILFAAVVKAGQIVPNNTHFDTTRANLEMLGARAVDLPCAESKSTSLEAPFKGNMDVGALRALVAAHGAENIPLIMMTVTNNAGGGQPVSMANLRAVSEIARAHGIPFYLDACRFAENAWFIKAREPEFDGVPVKEIVAEMFSLADGCTMSAKKDGIANIGGFIATNSGTLKQDSLVNLLVTEGFPTYGGLAGRDLEAIAVGLREAIQDDYLEYRAATVAFLTQELHEGGVPVLRPAGGHAVYVDARRFLPHIPPLQYPAQALCVELYIEAGVRAGEIGSVMFGLDHETGEERPAAQELMRLALPRRVYTASHLQYVADAIKAIHARRDEIRGLQIVSSAPVLRHFSARFAWVH